MKRLGFHISAIALVLGLVPVLSGCGGQNEGAVGAGPLPTVEASPAAPPAQPATGETGEDGDGNGGGEEPARSITYEVWFHLGDKLFMAKRTQEATEAVGRASLEALLAGPSDEEADASIDTQIPAGTRLLDLDIAKGIATVDLSSEFESGGGSASMFMRLGQVVYTLTQFPTVQGVRFRLDGQPVDVFSGEGIVLDHPVGRKDYEDLRPIISVETPLIGQRVTSPVKIEGSANVFEANVTLRILDADGRELARTFTTATCGTGCWGDYSIEVPFRVKSEQSGTVIVADDDADGDGKPAHEVRIPVTLVPGP